tara:strand:+ start:267 stop:488 length:222 start_codon:yes stop_codon:yes gene_type:complete
MKKLRAISFDNAQEINTLVHVLNQYVNNNKLYNDHVKKLLSVAIEVQEMFINPAKTIDKAKINKQIAKKLENK